MPFDSYLVAVRWINDGHELVAETKAALNSDLLKAEGVLRNAAGPGVYHDLMGVVHHSQLPRYFLASTELEWQQRAQAWYQTLPKQVDFILIHLAEYDGGTYD